MKSNEIRKKFLSFFESRGHRVVRSSSLVPTNDPTLLFTNAGMNQFKDVFLGSEKRDYVRACSSQKCVRAGGKHNDLEQVGRTTRHHTFFEMLGNFSFGDYFKKDAIPWAWELVTRDYGIPPAKLYVTVFREDDEAETVWVKDVGVPRDRVFRRDEKDNFWAMGETGPCGPCSEIHYDLGPAASDPAWRDHKDCNFPCDCGRYVELWNLVFMQYNRICDERDPEGKCIKFHDEPLPRPSIDTGAGLERLAAVLQGKISNFDTDLFSPLIDEAASLVPHGGIEYGTNHDTDVSLRIIADHARAAMFLISDGVLPEKGDRGYVLRKIIRRAIRHGRKLGIEVSFLFKLVGVVTETMKSIYPELLDSQAHIASLTKGEERRFARTLTVALRQYDDTPAIPWTKIEKMEQEYEKTTAFLPHSGGTGIRDVAISVRGMREGKYPIADQDSDFTLTDSTSGETRRVHIPAGYRAIIFSEDVFRLYDTFGMPWDLIRELADEDRIWVEESGFLAELEKQRERARAAWIAVGKPMAGPAYLELSMLHSPKFVGYETTRESNCTVVGLVEPETMQRLDAASPKDGLAHVEVILDRTPFYAEAGGQVGDTGWLLIEGERVARVEDTHSPAGLIAHRVKFLTSDGLRLADVVTAEVDESRRDAIRRNHTATHLLHAALRHTLGTHVKQAGSLVAPDRLRFDFTHYAGLGEQDVLDIEDLVNEHVLSNKAVNTEVIDLDSAVNSGAIALFGEKYGERVRVVSIADGSFSKELCGGTHVRQTGDIGLFKVISEGSVAAGTRRIEALTGEGLLEHFRKASETLALLSEALRAKPDELLQSVEKLAETEKKLRKQLESIQRKTAEDLGEKLVSEAQKIKGVFVIGQRVESMDRAALRALADRCRAQIKSGVVVLGTVTDGVVALVAAVTKDLTNRLDAGKIVKAAAAIVEGTGGGRKDLAEAGGKNPSRLDESIAAVPSIIEAML